MSFVAISKENHANSGVSNPARIEFCCKTPLIPISLLDIHTNVNGLPLGFCELNGVSNFVAICGIAPGENLFLKPNGEWFFQKVPLLIQTYPFKLIASSNDPEKQILTIADAPKFLVDKSEGVPIFNENGELTDQMKLLVNALQLLTNSFDKTRKAVEAIKELDLLEPWEIEFKKEKTVKLTGISRVNPEKFEKLSDEDFLKLRKLEAFSLVYCHFLSVPYLANLELAENHRSKRTGTLAKLGEAIFEGELGQELNFNFD